MAALSIDDVRSKLKPVYDMDVKDIIGHLPPSVRDNAAFMERYRTIGTNFSPTVDHITSYLPHEPTTQHLVDSIVPYWLMLEASMQRSNREHSVEAVQALGYEMLYIAEQLGIRAEVEAEKQNPKGAAAALAALHRIGPDALIEHVQQAVRAPEVAGAFADIAVPELVRSFFQNLEGVAAERPVDPANWTSAMLEFEQKRFAVINSRFPDAGAPRDGALLRMTTVLSVFAQALGCEEHYQKASAQLHGFAAQVEPAKTMLRTVLERANRIRPASSPDAADKHDAGAMLMKIDTLFAELAECVRDNGELSKEALVQKLVEVQRRQQGQIDVLPEKSLARTLEQLKTPGFTAKVRSLRKTDVELAVAAVAECLGISTELNKVLAEPHAL